MGKLDGKTALVTGAASGIGRATAELFAAEGARVCVADIDTRGAHVVAEIAACGGEAMFQKTDVTVPKDVEAAVDATVKTYGGLHILFNNAGVELERETKTADCSVEIWRRVIDVNLTGVFLGMKYAIPVMLAGGGGSIVNNASVSGLVGFAGIPAYCASKGGVVLLTKTTALEYARDGIRVNAVCPGTTLTPLVERFIATEGKREYLENIYPIGRFGMPQEIAALVLFLASDDSAFCTGAPFIIDGGNSAG